MLKGSTGSGMDWSLCSLDVGEDLCLLVEAIA
jgi:hypothetical protein